jgi:hypothetical protein
MNEKPQLFTALSVVTLLSGIINILYGVGVTASVVLGTLFFGIICAPITILPVVLGIFEILYATKLLANPPHPVEPGRTLAIFEIIGALTGNVFSLIAGILALVFYEDSEVKAYFETIAPPRTSAS